MSTTVLVKLSHSANETIQRLAYSEIYLCLATLLRRFDLELYETDSRCVDPKYDYFAPFPEKNDLSEERVRLLVK